MPPRAKQDQRIEVRFLWKEGLTQAEIHTRLVAVHGQAALSRSSVQRWVTRFQKEGEAVSDKPKSGRPITRQHAVPAIRQALQQDKRKSVRQLAAAANLSVGSTHRVLKKDLHLSKKPAKWIPHLLTAPQKLRQLNLARTSLGMFRGTRRNPALQRVVTMDESWFHVWDPESKAASRVWIAPGEPRPEKVRREISIRKCMLMVFFDREGVIHHEFVPDRHGIDRHLFNAILTRFRESLCRRRPILWTNTVPWALLQDGAPAHNARMNLDFLQYHDIKTLPHPGYSPNLNPCDYWFFACIKKHVQGIRHHTIQALEQAVDRAITNIPQADFAAAMDCLPRTPKVCGCTGRIF